MKASSIESSTIIFRSLFPSSNKSNFSKLSESAKISGFESASFLKYYAEWEFNAFLWVSLLFLYFVAIEKFFRLIRLWVQARNIPGPPSHSFFGHYSLLSRESLTGVLSDAHEKYGLVVKLWLGPTRLLVSLKNPEHIEEVLSKTEDKSLTGKVLSLALGESSLLVSSFEKVRINPGLRQQQGAPMNKCVSAPDMVFVRRNI